MKLINVKPGETFIYQGGVYEIDQYGSYGGKQVPVVNKGTGEKSRLSASTMVEMEVLYKTAQAETPKEKLADILKPNVESGETTEIIWGEVVEEDEEDED